MKYFTLFMGLAILAACQAPKYNVKEPDKNGRVVMRFEKTPCFGSCPTYEATLYENGLLLYNGKRFAVKIGCYYVLVTKEEVKKIRGWFNEAGFFELKASYPEGDVAPADLPSTIFNYREGGHEKRVEDKNWNTPAPLTNLGQKVETWIGSQNLQSCDK